MTRSRCILALMAAALMPACGGGGGGGSSGAPPTYTVLFTSPANGSGAVPRTALLLIYLSGPAEIPTVSGANVTVGDGAAPVAAAVSWVACLNAVQVLPGTSWNSGAIHTVSVGTGLRSAGGVALTPFTFSFTTSIATDVVRPTFLGIVSVTNLTTTSADLNWGAGSDDTTATGSLVYEIYATTNACFDFGAGPRMTSPAGATSATLAGLTSNTTYTFLVRARDQALNRDLNAATQAAKTLVDFSADLYVPIISTICTQCHVIGGEGSHMILTGGPTAAINAWVNVVPGDGAGTISMCDVPPAGVMFRVEPFDAPNSLVYRKISMDDPGCGLRMPRLQAPLPADVIQTFFDWIQQGAPNN